MGSKKGGGIPSNAGTSVPLSKGKSISDAYGHGVDKLAHGVSDMSMNSAEDDGWEVYGKKSKTKAVNSSLKQLGSPQPSFKAWSQADTMEKLGMRSGAVSGRGYGQIRPSISSDSRKPAGRGYTKPHSPDASYVVAPPIIPPPLKNGGVWASRAASSQSSGVGLSLQDNTEQEPASIVDEDDDDSDHIDESDDELMSDGFDSDESQKSHETRKKSRWFKDLFSCLDGLTVEQINDTERQWHCPACKGGPGAIDWYRGLQPLIAHARTKGSKRVKLHRELAELLDEELRSRGTSAIAAGEMYGKWKGLEERADKEIVWPPIVMIMNTQYDRDENDKWIGMGNQELLDYFSSYSATKARHSYGPQGHRGMSLLIFESTAVGYAEAERLSKHFEDTGRDRPAWGRNRVLMRAGGKRQLYGFMAEKQDMDSFNQHSQGKSKLKYEMRSYKEMVVNQMKQMSEDNQQLLYFKNKVDKVQMSKKALQESLGMVTEKLRKNTEEYRVVKLRTKILHEQKVEEMDSQEKFYQDQLQEYYVARNAKEDNFERIQQDQREKLAQQVANISSAEGPRRRSEEEIAKSIKLQDKELEVFTSERNKLMKEHDEQMKALEEKYMRMLFDEKKALEKKFDAEFDRLLEKHTPKEVKSNGKGIIN